MKIKTLLSFLIFIILFSSCAKTPGKTGAKIKLSLGSMMDLSSVAGGGAMLWGRSNKGDMFGEVISNSSSLQIDLDNGQWTFWAVAWDGAGGAAFSGLTRCAKTTANLNGTDVQLALTLANEYCADQDLVQAYAVNGGTISFPSIKHYECSNITDHKGYACKNNSMSFKKTTSKRLLMVGFRKANGGPFIPQGGGIASACVSGSADFVNERLPLGNGSTPLFTVLQSFFSSNACDETDPKGFVKEPYELGLMGTNKALSKSYIATGTCTGIASFPETTCLGLGGSFAGSCVNTGAAYSQLEENFCLNNGGVYTNTPATKTFELITTVPDAVLCSGPRVNPSVVSPHKFSSGDGSISSPYTICTETQLNSIDGDSSLLALNFALGSDLDMNSTSVFGTQSPPTCLAKDAGRNFNPIGGLYNNVCALQAGSVFSGSFNGNGHSVANIRVHEDDADYLGFIRNGGSTASVSNLILKNIEIEGGLKTAAVVGGMPGPLNNLIVKGGKIKGKNYVGGITAYTTALSMDNVHVSDMYIRVKNNSANAGGLIGESSSSPPFTLSKSSFDGVIELENSTMKVGGLIGYAVNTSISDSYSNGAILVSDSSAVGGLIGSSPNASVTSSYSKMSMGPAKNYLGDSANVGGIIGTHSTFVMRSTYYAGSMLFPCRNSVLENCAISPLSGGAALTASNITLGTMGAVLNESWFNPTYLSSVVHNTSLSTFEANVKISMMNNSTSFLDVGDVLPRLKWESGPCTLGVNNNSVVSQAASGRGSILNPIIICTRSQLLDIRLKPSLHYVLEDHIGIGNLPGDPLDRIGEFTGSIRGKNHVLGGFYVTYNIGEVGLIQRNNGTLSNIIFASSKINAAGSGDSAGVVAINGAAGVIENNKFLSVDFINGEFDDQGIVAGINRGKIFNNKVSGKMVVNSTAGLIAGKNETLGSITGNKVDGDMTLEAAGAPAAFGGAVGINNGRISEVAVGVTINNVIHTSTSYVGAFVGKHANGRTEDILVEPYAKINMGVAGPYYGQVFGTIDSDAKIKRVVAANELAAKSTNGAIPISFGGDGSGATYDNSFFMTGSAFTYKDDQYVMISSCAGNLTSTTYVFNSPINSPPSGFMSLMYFPEIGSDYLSKRINGSMSTVQISSIHATDFHVPCETGGVTTGVKAYYTAAAPNFSYSGVAAVTQAQLGNVLTYCPSRNSFSNITVAKCNTGEFDLTESNIGGFGFERLKTAYKKMVVDGVIDDSRPVWTFDASDGGYPRIFLAD